VVAQQRLGVTLLMINQSGVEDGIGLGCPAEVARLGDPVAGHELTVVEQIEVDRDPGLAQLVDPVVKLPQFRRVEGQRVGAAGNDPASGAIDMVNANEVEPGPSNPLDAGVDPRGRLEDRLAGDIDAPEADPLAIAVDEVPAAVDPQEVVERQRRAVVEQPGVGELGRIGIEDRRRGQHGGRQREQQAEQAVIPRRHSPATHSA